MGTQDLCGTRATLKHRYANITSSKGTPLTTKTGYTPGFNTLTIATPLNEHGRAGRKNGNWEGGINLSPLKYVDIYTCGSIHTSYADKRIVVVVVETERFMKKSASTAGTRLRAHFAQLAGAHSTECLSERPLRPKCISS